MDGDYPIVNYVIQSAWVLDLWNVTDCRIFYIIILYITYTRCTICAVCIRIQVIYSITAIHYCTEYVCFVVNM